MTKEIKLSVLLCVYNAEHYIAQAIQSVLNQTYSDFEFIIVEDGSTDGTRTIIESFSDPRISLIKNLENLGLTRSLNIGMKSCRGSYVARQDADDISLPNRFEKQLAYIEAHDKVGVVGSSYFIIDKDSNELYLKKYSFTGKELNSALLKKNKLCHGAVMMRYSAVESIGFYREGFDSAQDYDLWLRMAEKWELANLEEPLYKFRLSAGAISIAKRYEQDVNAEFVRFLAQQRRNCGAETVDINEYINNPLAVFHKLHIAPVKAKISASRAYLDGANLFFAASDYRTALAWLFKAMCNNFFEARSWQLLLKIILSMILTKKAVIYIMSRIKK